tara:strand:+ start:206 stop:967 length:762 start_codon:yes stop_codon:yes gene_type:complete
MESNPFEKFADVDLNEFRKNQIQNKKLEVEKTPELKKLQRDFEALEEYEAWEKALECLEKILKIKRSNPSALFNKGTLLMRLKRWEEALECFDEKIVMVQNDLQTWKNKGLCVVELILGRDNLEKISERPLEKFNGEFEYIEELRYAVRSIKKFEPNIHTDLIIFTFLIVEFTWNLWYITKLRESSDKKNEIKARDMLEEQKKVFSEIENLMEKLNMNEEKIKSKEELERMNETFQKIKKTVDILKEWGWIGK